MLRALPCSKIVRCSCTVVKGDLIFLQTKPDGEETSYRIQLQNDSRPFNKTGVQALVLARTLVQ